jgi:hypothetical protein
MAVFQIPQGKGRTPLFDFDCFGKHFDISEDDIRVTFADASDRTGSSRTGETSTSVIPSPGHRRRRLLTPLRRRVRALASSVMHTRRKLSAAIHHHRHPPNPIRDDNDPEEYDIPCLAYVTCLW